jgi:hypothetical protein
LKVELLGVLGPVALGVQVVGGMVAVVEVEKVEFGVDDGDRVVEATTERVLAVKEGVLDPKRKDAWSIALMLKNKGTVTFLLLTSYRSSYRNGRR